MEDKKIIDLINRKLERLATLPIYLRGQQYFRDGYVLSLKTERGESFTKIIGTVRNQNGKIYTTMVRLSGNEISEKSCNCPFIGNICKHMVAIVIAFLEGAYQEEEKIVPAKFSLLDHLKIKKVRPETDIQKIKYVMAFIGNTNAVMKFLDSKTSKNVGPLTEDIIQKYTLSPQEKVYLYFFRSFYDPLYGGIPVTSENFSEILGFFGIADVYDVFLQRPITLGACGSYPVKFLLEKKREGENCYIRLKNVKEDVVIFPENNPLAVYKDGVIYPLSEVESNLWQYVLRFGDIEVEKDDALMLLEIVRKENSNIRFVDISGGEVDVVMDYNPSPKCILDIRSGKVNCPVDIFFDYNNVKISDSVINTRYCLIEENNRINIIKRDMDFEKCIKDDLLNAGFEMEDGKWSIKVERLLDIMYHRPEFFTGRVVLSENSYARKISFLNPVFFRLRLAMPEGLNWFELRMTFFSGKKELQYEKVINALTEHKRFVEIEERVFLPLDNDVLQKLLEEAYEYGYYDTDKLQFRMPTFSLKLIEGTLKLIKDIEYDENVERLKRMFDKFEGIRDVQPPRSLNANLWEFQKKGLNWLAFLSDFGLSGILADDMGLGKTIQTISLLLYKKEKEGTRSNLVVTPTSVLQNWYYEIQKFAPSLRVYIYYGRLRREKLPSFNDYDVILTSYGILRRDYEMLENIKFRYVVLDEAQNIKNFASMTKKVSKLLKADYKLALTGTPLENRPLELWSIFDFLMPGYLGGLERFKRTYDAPIVKLNDEQASKRLKKLTSTFVLRRLKDQVASDLPPKMEIVQKCNLSEEQREIYKSVLIAQREKVFSEVEKKGLTRSSLTILSALTKLRQICCHPNIVKELKDSKEIESAKLELMKEIVQNVLDEGHRIIIYSQFVEMLSIIRRDFDKSQIPYLYLDGSTPAAKRLQIVDDFNRGEKANLFLISLKAGGVGLNITGADYVIHYDPWWNPAVMDQATDRVHRIGQTKNVFVYKLITIGTVEEKILRLQEEKKNIFEKVIGNEESIGKLIGKDDLAMLFDFSD
ncbi:MAG: DEAD/DEAH box helicase [Deltaproteobacteria bacterium]|nr:DEAD/DEAH box helicase [Deltaproteobacteria bacterium]